MIQSFEGKKPKIDKSVFVAKESTIIGDVEIGANSSVWFYAVIRADLEKIRIGKNCSIQDCCVLHTEPDNDCIIGDNVTIGHNSTLHSCRIENNVIVGMGATILSGAVVKANSIIAAGAVVTEGTIVEEKSIFAGVPAKKIADASPSHLDRIERNWKNYVALAKKYKK